MESGSNISPVGAGGKAAPLGFALLTSLFFAWGFLTCMNDILIPYLKSAFDLSYFQAMLVQMAFFMAYTIGSIAYFVISATSGDPIARIGYQNGIVLGLFISGLGALMFYPAGALLSYPLFLAALFILALGFTMLQISANPYVTVLGSESTASSRLNLSQGFNSLGTTLAPLVGGYFILQGGDSDGADNVRVPYLVFATALFVLGIIFLFIRLPKIQLPPTTGSIEALRHRHVQFGMLAIFCYVGAEVAVGSLLIPFLSLDDIAGMSESKASTYVAVYWGGLMIGRFLGAISMSAIPSYGRKLALMVAAMVAAFMVIFLAIRFKDPSFSMQDLWPFAVLAVLNFLAFLIGKGIAARTLMIFAVGCAALLVLGMLSSGPVAMWAVIGIGLFNSIMWSNIFSLAIEGLGEYKSQASSLLVMMILGGALLPPLQGELADQFGVQASYALPIVAYLYLAWYGLSGYRIQHTSKEVIGNA